MAFDKSTNLSSTKNIEKELDERRSIDARYFPHITPNGERENEFHEIEDIVSLMLSDLPPDMIDETTKAMTTFLLVLGEYKQKMSDTTDPDEFERLLAEGQYEAAYQSANELFDPDPMMRSFEDINIQDTQGEIEHAILCNPHLNFTEDMFSPSRILRYFEHRLHTEDERDTPLMRASKHDILYQRECDKGKRRFPVCKELRNGFLDKFRSLRKYAKRQGDIYFKMMKSCKSVKDLELWWSRLTYTPAIELAQEGYIYPLQCMITLNEQDIRKEISSHATRCGIECSPSDIDYDKVVSSTHTLLVARTGFMRPESYLHSIQKSFGYEER